VYAKSREAQERQTYDRKQTLQAALASGKPLPTELRRGAQALARDLPFDAAQAGAPTLSSSALARAH
jgi:U3 small nucleolar ribonucleoprotein protein IMP4